MPGVLNNARWLTKANRILRLYKPTSKQSEPLCKVVSFIVNVYAPSWFHIKQHSSCLHGSKNFFHLMKLCYELDPDDWKIVRPVLENNNYFAHPENILLAAMGDENDEIRNFG